MIRDIEHFQAIADLLKGDPARACAILRTHQPLDPELADALADALSQAKLHKGRGGRPRTMTLFQAEHALEMKRGVMALAVEAGHCDLAGAEAWYESRVGPDEIERLRKAEDLVAHKKARRPKKGGNPR